MHHTLLEADSDPFAEQLELSRVHPQLVPMRRQGLGYLTHPSAARWRPLPTDRGFAGFGLKRGLRMLLDVLAGLHALHETQLGSGAPFAHGEIAPLHFRIDPQGVCRLVPFIQRHQLNAGVDVPQAALGYSSPERLIGEQVGARADVFSIGVLLWETLACRRLFDERNAEAIIDRLMNEELQAPNVPAHFSWACPLEGPLSRALQVNQLRRSIDCSELAEAIAKVAHDRLPSHAEVAAFFSGSLASVSPPRESAIFTRATVPTLPSVHTGARSAPLELHKQRGAPLRFTTVRMSAVQLRENGLFDAVDGNASDDSLRASTRTPSEGPSADLSKHPAPRSTSRPPPPLPTVPSIEVPPSIEALPCIEALPLPEPPPRSSAPPRRTSPPPLPTGMLEIPQLPSVEPDVAHPATPPVSARAPTFTSRRRRNAPLNKSVWIAIGVLLTAASATAVFAEASGMRTRVPSPHLPKSPGVAALGAATGSASGGTPPATSGDLTDEGARAAASDPSAPFREPSAPLEGRAASPSGPAPARTAAPSIAPRSGARQGRDYGI
ncbi:MAG: hypothetical protein ABW061_22080 [Polyangiaceae bacterium]